MPNDLSQLDQLIESDILDALGSTNTTPSSPNMGDGLVQNVPEEYFQDENTKSEDSNEGEVIEDIGDIEILPLAEIESAIGEQEEEITISSNGNELLSVLTQLLNNKTIEITIKIKD